jgi:hypothetical protein
MMDCNSFSNSQGVIMDTPVPDEVQLLMRPLRLGKQMSVEVSLEDIQMKKKATTLALVDSRCTRMCIDEAFAGKQGWPLELIKNPILVKYTDRMVTEAVKIHYLVNL